LGKTRDENPARSPDFIGRIAEVKYKPTATAMNDTNKNAGRKIFFIFLSLRDETGNIEY